MLTAAVAIGVSIILSVVVAWVFAPRTISDDVIQNMLGSAPAPDEWR